MAFGAGALLAGARQLSPDEALAAAFGAPAHNRVASMAPSQLELVATFESEDNDMNTLYAFNKKGGRGFVILAADDVAVPVLGSSDTGSINPADMPSNLVAWLDSYSRQIAYAAANGGRVVTAAPRVSYQNISPMLTTQWNQDAPYNNLAPTYGGHKCVTGCVATAIAQVMNYHRWPVTGTGTYSYRWNGRTLSFDYGATTFDWDNMLDSYPSATSGTAQQRTAVATLMYACGVAADMDYYPSGSGATEFNLAQGMIDHLGYDRGIVAARRDFYEYADWIGLVYGELAADRPVLYTGATVSGEGHAFVLDGYRASDGYFHVNWGWGGMSDGYFAITTLDPDNQGIGGASAGFSESQGALLGVGKAQTGSSYVPNMAITGDITPSSATYQRNNATYVGFTPTGAIYNYSLADMSLEMGMRLTNKSTGAVSYVWWAYGPQELSGVTKAGNVAVLSGEAYMIQASQFPSSGAYTVTPVVRTGGNIYDAHVQEGCVRELTLTASSGTLTFAATGNVAELTADNIQAPVATPWQPYTISARITNTGTVDLQSQQILAGFFYAEQKAVVFASTVSLASGESKTVTFTGNVAANVPAGTYDLLMQYEYGGASKNVVFPDTKITVAQGVEINLTDLSVANATGRGSNLRPYAIPREEPMQLSFTIQAAGGAFNDYLCWMVLDPSATDAESQRVAYEVFGPESVAAGQTAQFSRDADVADLLAEDKTYALTLYRATVSGNSASIDNFSNGTVYKYIKLGEAAGIGDVAVSGAEASVFPSPAVDVVTVSAPVGVCGVKVFSLSGAQLISAGYDGSSADVSLSLGSLPAGVYVAAVTDAAGVTANIRIIKN